MKREKNRKKGKQEAERKDEVRKVLEGRREGKMEEIKGYGNERRKEKQAKRRKGKFKAKKKGRRK